jgi:hypothetical protein
MNVPSLFLLPLACFSAFVVSSTDAASQAQLHPQQPAASFIARGSEAKPES